MIERVDGLGSSHLVANEAQLKDIINKPGSQFPMLLATIPSSSSNTRDADAAAEVSTCLIFVLDKAAASDRTTGNYIDKMAQLQQTMQAIKQVMLADYAMCDSPGHQVMKDLALQSLNQDPEYNYLGTDGWSLSFRLETDGW
jgi:hypothetical protein